MRLELVIGDAPVLDRHVLGQEFGAVALRQMRAQHGSRVGRKRQVSAFQCTPPPPTPLGGMNEPQVRIGSAVWLTLLRNVIVCCAGRRNRSWRM